MKFKHKTLIFLAGCVWLVIGILLLSLGIHFILDTVRNPALTYMPGRFSISRFIMKFVSDPTQSVIVMITLCLSLGYVKGKMVLGKSVRRQVKRIESLPNPARLKYLYSKGYYLLIGCMMLLGMVLKFFPITVDTRGAIDITIGSALINGAMLYFRICTSYTYLKKEEIER